MVAQDRLTRLGGEALLLGRPRGPSTATRQAMGPSTAVGRLGGPELQDWVFRL